MASSKKKALGRAMYKRYAKTLTYYTSKYYTYLDTEYNIKNVSIDI